MSNPTLSLGYIPDEADSRDRGYGELLSSHADLESVSHDNATYVLEPFLPTPLNQRTTSSCVGCAATGAIYTRLGAQGQSDRRLPSCLWLYSIARATHDAEDEDAGTTLRGLMKAVAALGIAPEEAMPFNPKLVNERPNWKAMRTAADQKWVKGYYRIGSTGLQRLEAIKGALRKGFPVIYGLQIDEQWRTYSAGDLLTGGSRRIGGHATFLYGYEGDAFLGQNSWGTLWGDKGRYRIYQNVLMDATDLWIFDTVPRDLGTK